MNVSDVKWSTTMNDSSLLNSGYGYTKEKDTKWSSNSKDYNLQ